MLNSGDKVTAGLLESDRGFFRHQALELVLQRFVVSDGLQSLCRKYLLIKGRFSSPQKFLKVFVIPEVVVFAALGGLAVIRCGLI